MIELKRGDILGADVEALVNTVNCVGVMGRGIALQFRKAFPDNFEAYARACTADQVQPGSMFVHERHRFTNPRIIVNFPTKRHWRGRSQLADIEAGLVAMVDAIRRHEIRSIAIPPLGCGLGGLDWSDVRPMIEQALAATPDVRAILFEPGVAPDAHTMARVREVPRMTAGRAALLGLMERYLAGLMVPFVTLVELHKLMFFMQEAGEGLRLRYAKAAYGPYAENLRHVLGQIEGHFISGYADGGDAPDKRLELVPGALGDATRFLDTHPATRERFDRVAQLVRGFETPFGLELLGTVYWVASREDASTIPEVIAGTHGWNVRKRRFTPDQIGIAFDTLTGQGWLPSQPH